MSSAFRTIGLYGKYQDPSVGTVINKLARYLASRGVRVLIERDTAVHLSEPAAPGCPPGELEREIDLAIVVGGDGTMLHVARALAPFEVPLLGVNLGRLGFLTDVSAEHMTEEIGKIIGGDFASEERNLLQAEIMRAGRIVHSEVALNDVIIGKGELSRLIEFETYLNGEFVNHMRADGVIVATPTGSTAYALSAGGPILEPTLGALVLVPICPHTLSARPIVLSDDRVVEIVIAGSRRHAAHITLDGQTSHGLESNDRVYVRKTDTPVHLIHPSNRNHYYVLRAKLRWGEQLGES